jgi:uncharacterized protein (TIGR00290 family)
MMGIPLIEKRTKAGREFDDLEAALNSIRDEIDGVVVGSVASNTKKMEIDALCKRLELLPLAPLWHAEPAGYMRNMVEDGFEVLVVAAQRPLTKDWLGRKLDAAAIDEISLLSKKHGLHVAGEGGEYDTFVVDCPMFIRRPSTCQNNYFTNSTFSMSLNALSPVRNFISFCIAKT